MGINGDKALLAVAALGEAATGLGLLVASPLVVRWLFGAQIHGAGLVMSRIAGLALIALGVACWPGGIARRALCGMLTYSALATLFLIYLGLGGAWTGRLLWPAVALHAVMALLLTRAWIETRKSVLPPN